MVSHEASDHQIGETSLTKDLTILTSHKRSLDRSWLLSDPTSFIHFRSAFSCRCYYVQEASSMFFEQALKQTVDLSQPLKVLDLCAAPGGKSTHIQSLISEDSLLGE